MQVPQSPARPHVFKHCYSLRFLATLKRTGAQPLPEPFHTSLPHTHTVSSDISILNTLSAKHAEGVLATKRCHSARGAILLDERAAKEVNDDRGGAKWEKN
jgi:hypothetical protein